MNRTICAVQLILEWIPKTNNFRISWNQKLQSLQEGKVKKDVLEELKNHSLDLPKFPKIY